jgi:hypothetical protein
MGLVNNREIYKCKRLFLLSPNTAVSIHGEPPSHMHTPVHTCDLGHPRQPPLFPRTQVEEWKGREKIIKDLFIKYFTSPR